MRALLCAFVLALSAAAQAQLNVAPPDVRLLLDVSGSMRAHDPANLRSDAVSLLVRTLPDEGRGGIWVFANTAVEVVEHGTTDLFWRRLASIHTRELDSRGSRSNLPAALAAATWDLDETSTHQRHIVLLSDGRIDISPEARRNEEARARFLKESLPKIAASDFIVHSIVLSQDADGALLRQLSERTGGMTFHARSGEELARHFRTILKRTAAPAYLPVRNQSFMVEPGLGELVLYRQGDEEKLQLIGPDGTRHTRQSPGVDVRWHDAKGFDVLTLSDPAPGRWRFDGKPAEVVALSDVVIRATSVPASLFPGDLNHIDFMLFSGGGAIVDPTFLGHLEASALLSGEREARPLYVESLDDGLFRAHMLDVVRPGPYVLELTLTGRTFARSLMVPFDLANPVRISATEDGRDLVVWAELNNAAVDYSTLRVAAQVRAGTGPRQLVPAAPYPGGLWQIRVPSVKGAVETTFSFSGNYLNQKEFHVKTSPVKLRLPIHEEQAFVFDQRGKAIPESVAPEPEADPLPAPVATAAVAAEPSDALVEDVVPELELPLPFVGVVSLVNLLLMGFLFFILRPKQLSQALQDRLAQIAEAAAEEPAPA